MRALISSILSAETKASSNCWIGTQPFPKVWGILGWNIKLYHSHLIVLPPLPPEERDKQQRLGWHQDSGRLNFELEGDPRPRISLKVAFFLTDTSVPGRGNFSVVPGSQKWNTLEMPEDTTVDPEKATPVFAKPGTAVFFDRRLWHAAGRNTSDTVRKVLFYGTVTAGCNPATT